MTLALIKAKLALCYIYNLILSIIHIKDLICIVKNGVYIKNKLFNCVIKIILYVRDISNILA
jgi:hypothetical protein